MVPRLEGEEMMAAYLRERERAEGEDREIRAKEEKRREKDERRHERRRKTEAKRRKRMERAARKIQRAYRSRLFRRRLAVFMQEKKAAVKVQAMIRGMVTWMRRPSLWPSGCSGSTPQIQTM